MRRPLLLLTLLLGVILQPRPAAASPTHRHHAPKASARPGRAAASRSGGSLRSAGLHSSRPRSSSSRTTPTLHRNARLRSLRTLHRLRAHTHQTLATLRTDAPQTSTLIDPVPLTGFHIPPALKGTHDSLVRQNVRAEADGLLRIEDDDALLVLRKNGALVALPTGETLRVDERLPSDRRYCRAWTASFLADLARVHYGRFHRSLQVNSAVRTVAFQRTLGRRNGNAAAADGDIASPHLTGATIDIAKKGLSMQEIGWMRAYLLPLQTAGKLDVEEEFYQACFHITVYKSYVAPSTIPRAVPPLKTAMKSATASTALLAARVR